MRSAFASLDPVWKLIQVWNLHRGNFPPVKNLIFFLQLKINNLICDLQYQNWSEPCFHISQCWRHMVAKFETKLKINSKESNGSWRFTWCGNVICKSWNIYVDFLEDRRIRGRFIFGLSWVEFAYYWNTTSLQLHSPNLWGLSSPFLWWSGDQVIRNISQGWTTTCAP